ncbi:hypothetical protein [Metabacillus arenae]|uniref:Uncharacterized protein n=1 Tax=Metabacillus arenae TaxID=2771434 RepID=A0A926NCN4_9BACI|nr:hypothetical protein [Metabacillus arenae]MBD1379104.1 hypothetical protein [Metabacillus arenae]
MKPYQPNKKNSELFEMVDRINECNEELNYFATRDKSKRLDHIESNAKQIEKIAIEIQKQVKSMRRK